VAVTPTFEQFTCELADRLRVAESMGWSPQEITRRAAEIGDYLARHVEPRSPEQRLLKEMWEEADEREQQAIAGCLVKMIQRHHAGNPPSR